MLSLNANEDIKEHHSESHSYQNCTTVKFCHASHNLQIIMQAIADSLQRFFSFTTPCISLKYFYFLLLVFELKSTCCKILVHIKCFVVNSYSELSVYQN